LATPLLSSKAGREDGVSDDLRERGVKNRLNFRGVIEGFRLSLLVDVSSCGACVEERWSGRASSWDGGGVVLSRELPVDIVLDSRVASTV
jgi:hypothetical protein